MKRFYTLIYSLLFCLFFAGCNLEDEYDISPKKNFDTLWKILDEYYCFFEFKEVDWDEMYDKYSPQVNDFMSENELFYVLSDMTYELKDGHVNIFTDFLTSSYEGWHTDYPSNIDWKVLNDFLNKNGYGHAGEYKEIIFAKIANKEVAYMHYRNFAESILERDLDTIFSYFKDCKGLIIDVRDNGGGSLTNSDRLATRFVQEKTLCGYIKHKTGKGRNDFSDPYPIYLKPSHAQLWTKPVVVITNRRCYSATNNFVSKMKELPNVYILGGKTGGGSGFPFTSELPNGWRIRFSTSPIMDINMQHTEFGVDPDIEVILRQSDQEKGIDTLIEAAANLILSNN